MAEVTEGPVDSAAIAEILSAATHIDGVAPLSEQSVLGIGTLPEVVVTDNGQPVAYANITPSRDDQPAMVEAVVTPEFRRRGLGKRLVTTALERAGAGARVWAHGDLAGAQATAASLQLTAQRILLQLRRPFGAANPLPPLVIPDSLELRTYQPGDDEAILAVNNRAFAWHPEQGGWGSEHIRERVDAEWFDARGLFLAFDRTSPSTPLLGFHWTKIADGLGEVYVVGVDPAAQGRGVGKLLTVAGLHYLEAAGLPAVLLYVEGDNAAALATYRALGFTDFAKDIAYGR